MKSYEILRNLCQTKNDIRYGNEDRMTNRASFILDYLEGLGLEYVSSDPEFFGPDVPGEPEQTKPSVYYTYDEFDYYGRIMCNISVHLNKNPESDKRIVLLSHHDIVNPESDNMNDNTASVSHLLEMCSRIMESDIKRNISIVITDGEECGSSGSEFLTSQINQGLLGDVEYALNLELTGVGKEIHIERFNDSNLSKLLLEANSNIHQMSIPFNDSLALRRGGVDSICIGLLPLQAINERKSGSYPKEWGLCHDIEDRFENAVEEDMIIFNDFLFDFIQK